MAEFIYWTVVFAGLIFAAIVAMFAVCALGLDRFFVPSWEDEFDRDHGYRPRVGVDR